VRWTRRSREGPFEPLLIPKGERRFQGVDQKIIAMHPASSASRPNP
jgi:transposase-like protein